MSLFVGRTPELAKLVSLLETTEGAVVEVVGIHGIGKSRLLEQLDARARETDGVFVAPSLDFARLELRESARSQHDGPASEAAALWETFLRSNEFMQRFVAGIGSPRAFGDFRQASFDAKRRLDLASPGHTTQLGKGAASGTITQTSTVNLGDEVICQEIRKSQAAVDDAFVSGWADWSVRLRVLIVVDGFECVLDAELGDWFVRTALRLRNTLTVLARLPVSQHTRSSLDPVERIDLVPFDADEVAEYIRQRFGGDARSGIAAGVHDFTGGHPGGVHLAGNLLSETGIEDLEATELRRMLQRLPDSPEERWAALVRLILDVVEDESLREVVEACSVVNSFTDDLLADLIDADPGSGAAGDAIQKLLGYGIVAELPSMTGEPSRDFRLHEFIRISLNRNMRMAYQGRAQELDRRAAGHYYRKLSAWEDEPSATYGAWYRWEHPDYQLYKRRWLHHAAQGVDDVELARGRFVLVFLEVFWWWGCYHHFEYTHRLLDDWRDSGLQAATARHAAFDADPANADPVGEALGFVLEQYPLGHVKDDAPWDEIRDRLLRVRDLCGLRKGVPKRLSGEDADDMGRVAGLLSAFLAHTRRFGDPADAAAGRYYAAAIATFEKLDDDWMLAWLHFERADLELERGQLDAVVEPLGRSVAVLEAIATRDDEWDEELVANLARARADLHWEHGEHVAAVEWYGRAVRHAYRLQGEHLPDGYTQRFYREITGRPCERLVELAREGAGARALELAGMLRSDGLDDDEAAVLLAAGDPARLAERLFLPGPRDEELRSPSSTFMTRWRVVEEEAADTGDDVALLQQASIAS